MQQETRQYYRPSSTVVETLDPFPKQIFNINNSSSEFLPSNNTSNVRDRTSEFQKTVKTFASKDVSDSVYRKCFKD